MKEDGYSYVVVVKRICPAIRELILLKNYLVFSRLCRNKEDWANVLSFWQLAPLQSLKNTENYIFICLLPVSWSMMLTPFTTLEWNFTNKFTKFLKLVMAFIIFLVLSAASLNYKIWDSWRQLLLLLETEIILFNPFRKIHCFNVVIVSKVFSSLLATYIYRISENPRANKAFLVYFTIILIYNILGLDVVARLTSSISEFRELWFISILLVGRIMSKIDISAFMPFISWNSLPTF
jgi:hypothetical protein